MEKGEPLGSEGHKYRKRWKESKWASRIQTVSWGKWERRSFYGGENIGAGRRWLD